MLLLNGISETAQEETIAPVSKGFWPPSNVIFCCQSPSCPRTFRESFPAAEFLGGKNALIISPTNKSAAQSTLVSVNYCRTFENALAHQEAATEQTQQESGGAWGVAFPSVPCLDVRLGCLDPLPTYLWPLGDAGVGRHHGQAGMRRPRRSRAAGPFLSKRGPISSAFQACSLQCVVQEGSNRGLC